MSPSPNDLIEIVNLAAWRVKGLDADSRRQVLQEVISEKLSSVDFETRRQLLFTLLEKFELTAPSEELLSNPVPQETNSEGKTQNLPNKKAEPNIFDVVAPAAAPQPPASVKMPAAPVEGDTFNKENLQRAFNESVERMLNALNPEYLKSYVKKRTMQSDKAYKSELFDSYEEKFVQLVAYHEKGRLFKDFWALFRENLKK